MHFPSLRGGNLISLILGVDAVALSPSSGPALLSRPQGDGHISLVFVVAGASPSPSVWPPKSVLMMVAAKRKVSAAAAVVTVL